jgi:hypothetical protein
MIDIEGGGGWMIGDDTRVQLWVVAGKTRTWGCGDDEEL